MTNVEAFVLFSRLHSKAKEITDMIDWDYVDGDGKKYLEKVKQMNEEGWAKTYERIQSLRKRGISVSNLYG